MPIKYSKESIFNEKNVQTIVNTINCIGVMGAGIAQECKLRFPDMYKDYKKRVSARGVHTGEPYLFNERDDIWILNFPTKFNWKEDSKPEWIEEGLKYFVEHYNEWGIESIAFPRLGSDRGGLKWKDVEKLMKKYLSDLDIPVHICLDNHKEPKGLEKDMTFYLNKLNEEDLGKIGVKKYIIPRMVYNLPVNRFRELSSYKGVGRRSYEKVYEYIYDKIVNEGEKCPKRQPKLTWEWETEAVKNKSRELSEDYIIKKSVDAIFITLIKSERFWNSERGFQGQFRSVLEKITKGQFPEGTIIEEEYQKRFGRHGNRLRPDIIIHIPYDGSNAKSRRENNYVVYQIKINGSKSDIIDDFKKLDTLINELNYPLGILINLKGKGTSYLEEVDAKNRHKLHEIIIDKENNKINVKYVQCKSKKGKCQEVLGSTNF